MLCKVNISLEIWAINEISLRKQDLEVEIIIKARWKDNRLTVNPNISSQSLWPVINENEAKKIWMPKILFRNCKGCSPVSLSKSEDLYLNRKTKFISAQIRLLHRFACAIDLRAYPMDIQFCQIQLYTYEDTEDVIHFEHAYPKKDVTLGTNVTLAEYRILPIMKTSCNFKNPDGLEFTCIELILHLEHMVPYHLMTAYAPTFFIVMLSWISFWLSVDLVDARVSLGLTSLLTLATRHDQVQNNLPPVAYAKAIDVWMFACIILVSSSLCEFAISHYQWKLSKKRPRTEARSITVEPVSDKDKKLVHSSSAPGMFSRGHIVNDGSTSLDRASRIIFPLAFLLFNIIYWSYYLTFYN